MILTRIQANNVLKYAQLDIDLPRSGLIAISGQNESGKSSIGETVCFALFGRTFSIAEAEIEKVVRWGENHCTVNLEFEVDGKPYLLSRFLDRDGNHSAKLSHPDTPDAPLARGIANVAEAMRDLLGYGYAEFVESFYLAQREITTPHPHSQAVKIMAGVAPLERVSKELQSEIGERAELLDEIQAECDAVEQEIQALAIRDGQLVDMENAHAETLAQGEQVRALREDLRQRMDAYDSNVSELHAMGGRRGRASALRGLFFLLMLLLGAAWGLLVHGAEFGLADQQQQLRDLVVANTPADWPAIRDIWFGWAALAAAVLFVLSWSRVAGITRRSAHLRRAAAGLAEHLQAAREIEIEEDEPEAAEEGEGGDTDELRPDATGAVDAPVRPDQVEFDTLFPQVRDAEATVRQTRDYVERELAWLEYVDTRLVFQARELDDEIADERVRLQEAENLASVREGLAKKRDDINGRIQLRRTAMELLGGAVTHQSSHFNRDIKNLVGRTLPLFTEGRYEHLQIGEDLGVRVFSADKRDFMDLEEVSSGTQRQIMLALRLALSQKLLARAVNGEQFAFLDEPFAFFDEERTRHALRALTRINDGLSQIWIVAQSFPETGDLEFDAEIACERGEISLSLQRGDLGSGAPGPAADDEDAGGEEETRE